VNGVILVDERGVPFDRPEPPAPDADIETKIAYIRAVHAYNEKVTASANASFDKALRNSLKEQTL
jgi:hypothetical protein